MYPTLDDLDRANLRYRHGLYASISGIRIGDFVRFADTRVMRVAYIWRHNNTIQVASGGSFYFGESDGGAFMSYSGGLESPMPISRFAPTDEEMDGNVWTFHHEYATANNDVHMPLPFRVFVEVL